jgi:hypothetical protein
VREGNATAVRQILLSSRDDTGQISAGFDDAGNSSLHLAAKEGNVSCLRVLLSFGATPNAQNNVGHTPLLVAWTSWSSIPDTSFLRAPALIQVETLIELLLQHGADPTISGDEIGETPLHLAARYGQPKIVKRLLQFRGRPDQRSNGKDGLTPLELAEKGDSTECVQILREKIFRLNSEKDEEEWNPDQLARPTNKQARNELKWSGARGGSSSGGPTTNISSASFKRQQQYLAKISASEPAKLEGGAETFNPRRRLGALRTSPESKPSEKMIPSKQNQKRGVAAKQTCKPIIAPRFGFDRSVIDSLSSTWSPPKTFHPVTR